MPQSEFDSFAQSYEQGLAKSLAITGEGREFYAQKRIDWTAECLARLNLPARRILDYGCGDGANVPVLAARFQAEQVLGVDVSSESIAVARRAHASRALNFLCTSEWVPDGTVDLAFTNGVFHHIAPSQRHECLAAIRRSLRAGGVFAFWENNPWNPGTHYVMSQCAFDQNAIKISPREAREILLRAGFKILRTDSLFYFPRQLRFLRAAESWLRGLPFGGQYMVLCQSPTASRLPSESSPTPSRLPPQ
jgi:SAM-dependent methyltransferase